MVRVRVKRPIYIKRKKTSVFKKKWFWNIIILVFIFTAFFYFLGFSQVFLLKTVKIQGNETISSENIEAAALENAKDFLPIFSSKSIIFIDKSHLAQVLKNIFSRISSVKIKKRLPATLEVMVRERIPVAILCAKTSCYLIDEGGVVFKEVSAQVTQETGLVFEGLKNGSDEAAGLPWFEDISFEGKIILGERALEPIEVKKFLAISEGLSAVPGLQMAKLKKIDPKRADVILQEGWQIFFNLDDQISYQINNLKLILEKQIKSQDRPKLEYIDLRFGSRIYYKFKQGFQQTNE